MRHWHKALLALAACTAPLAGCATHDSINESGREPDGGSVCEPKPLHALCTASAPCPVSPAEATAELCADDAPRTFAQSNACGGMSVIYEAGFHAVYYHYDDEGELVGVHVFTDTPRRCTDAADAPAVADTEYGRSCELTGTQAPACEIACPTIACISGAAIVADWPLSFSRARGTPITACRNDECFTGMLARDAEEPAQGSGIGFTVPDGQQIDRDQSGHVSVSFMIDSAGATSLRMEWTPWSDADLHDGDHYRLSAVVDGRTLTLIDREVDYGTHELGGDGACHQSCSFVELDVRGGSLDEDGGVDEDAGL